MNTTETPTKNPHSLAFGVGMKASKKSFYPILVNVNIKPVAMCLFDPLHRALLLLSNDLEKGSEDYATGYEYMDYGFPTAEFITALRDQMSDKSRQLSNMAVDEFGCNTAYDLDIPVHKVEIRIMERSNIASFSFAGYDGADQRFVYKVGLENGWKFLLRVRSKRPEEKMMELGFDSGSVIIAGVRYPIFVREDPNQVTEDGAVAGLLRNYKVMYDVYCLKYRNINLDKIEARNASA